MHRHVRRAGPAAAWTTAAIVILLAVVTAGFRVLAPILPEYRTEVSTWASAVLGAPVELDGIDLRWRGARPEFVLSGVRFVSADARSAVSVSELRIGLSLRSLFARGRLAPARIVLIAPDATVIAAAGDVIESGKPQMLEFGVADETAWRAGLSCGGNIRVYVEKVD